MSCSWSLFEVSCAQFPPRHRRLPQRRPLHKSLLPRLASRGLPVGGTFTLQLPQRLGTQTAAPQPRLTQQAYISQRAARGWRR